MSPNIFCLRRFRLRQENNADLIGYEREDLLHVIDDLKHYKKKSTIGEFANALAAPPVLNAAATLTEYANAGRVNLVPNVAGDITYTLPTPIAGMQMEFINSQGATGGLTAADGHDVQIATQGTSIFLLVQLCIMIPMKSNLCCLS